jgi:flagellar hook-associated protein 2
MRISIGVAEQVAYRTGFNTEFSTEGAIFNQRRSLETRKSEFQKQIEALELRINKKQETLTNKYVRLEVALAQLQSQSDYLTQQLDNLPGYLLSKK